ncbi:SpoIIE family protein phosphatase [Streptomyces sp. NPDC047002]|uniref:SpoIIE family protein phosphatase n=1 Tax=Streptomyces sp. NPDC047002 TaxID=3155475 RepID=UPI0034529ACD
MAQERRAPAGEGPLLIMDGAGTVCRWSARAERVFGRSRAEAVGRPAVWATSTCDAALRVRPYVDDGARWPAEAEATSGTGEAGETGGAAGALCWTVELAEAGEGGDGPEERAWDAAVLDALFGQSPVGLHILDTDLRVVRADSGTARSAPAGRRFDEVYRLADPAGQEAAARRILATGVPAVERTVRVFADPQRTRERLYAVSCFRLHDRADGRVLGLAVVAVDRTERERAKALADLLATARDRVGRSLDTVATCQDLAQTLAPGFADRVEVEIADTVVHGAQPPVPGGAQAPLLRCAAAVGTPLHDRAPARGAPSAGAAGAAAAEPAEDGGADTAAGKAARAGASEGSEADAGSLSDAGAGPAAGYGGAGAGDAAAGVGAVTDEEGAVTPAGAGGVSGAWPAARPCGERAGEARVLRRAGPEARALDDLQPHLADLRGSGSRTEGGKPVPPGTHTLLVVPLALRGGALGLLHLYRTGASEPFTRDEVATAVEIAAHAALAVDNARRYAHERALAATVQRRLLPQRADDPPLGVRTAHAYRPGPAGGGAWYDVIPLSGACSAFVVGEVAGDGIHAATAMGQVRTAVRAFATLGIEPDELLARVDEVVAQLAAERRALPAHDPLRAEPLTVACVYAVHDAGDGLCTVARGGGADPWLAAPGGPFAPLGAPEGPVLGDLDIAPFASLTVELAEGSALVLSASPAARVRPVLGSFTASDSVRAICEALARDARGDSGGHGNSGENAADGDGSDAVFLAAETTALPADTTVSWRLDPDEQAPARARSLAVDWLAGRVGGEAAFGAELVVSELVTNAVRYGVPPLTLRLILGRVLTVEVKDASPTTPHLRHARTHDEGGRGLFIIAQLADRWGTRRTPQGKTIWAEMSRG